MNITDIGKTIKIARIKKGMSQKELAEAMGVDISAISLWEKNKRIPSGDLLIKLANELDIVEDFFPNYTRKIEDNTIIISDEIKRIKQRLDLMEKNFIYSNSSSNKTILQP